MTLHANVIRGGFAVTSIQREMQIYPHQFIFPFQFVISKMSDIVIPSERLVRGLNRPLMVSGRFTLLPSYIFEDRGNKRHYFFLFFIHNYLIFLDMSYPFISTYPIWINNLDREGDVTLSAEIHQNGISSIISSK